MITVSNDTNVIYFGVLGADEFSRFVASELFTCSFTRRERTVKRLADPFQGLNLS